MDSVHIIDFETKFKGGDSMFLSKPYNGIKKLTLKLDKKNNDKVINILKDSYDNDIVIDNKKDYCLVIHNLPMRTYFNIIENKNNGFYTDFDIVHYSSKKLEKYIDKTIDRNTWLKLDLIKNHS